MPDQNSLENPDPRQAQWAALGRMALDAMAPLFFGSGGRFHDAIPLGSCMIAKGVPALVKMIDEGIAERDELRGENASLREWLASIILAYKMDDDLFAPHNAVLAADISLNPNPLPPVEPTTDGH